jgi:glycosyltransferase involved in cell wall biosynthesis
LFNSHLHISEYSRAVMRQTGKPWAYVIMGGVDAEKFSPDPLVRRERRALFVGRLLPHKGLADLVEGIPSDLPLDIIGQPYDPDFFARLKQRAAGKQITFRHDCDDAGLVDAYRRTSCVVLPSVYEAENMVPTLVPELLGQTLLEGMACGAPGICTDVASLPEVVEHGVTGFVVPPNDPAALGARIRSLVERPDQVTAMGRAGRDRVIRHFTWDAVVDRCLRAYST